MNKLKEVTSFPKVTVIILTYNQEKYIAECISSVLKQKFSEYEVIVSDDCSTDHTYDISTELMKSTTIDMQVLKTEQNIGLVGNFNYAVSKARGKYIISLGGDDVLLSSHISTMYDFIEKNSVNIVDGSGQYIDSNGNHLGYVNCPNLITFSNITDYLKNKIIPSFAPGRIFNRKLVVNFDPIHENSQTEDSVLVFRSLLLGDHVRINSKSILYRIHDTNLSSTEGLKKMNNYNILIQKLSDLICLQKRNPINNFLGIILSLIRECKVRELNKSYRSPFRRIIDRFFLSIFLLIVKFFFNEKN